MGIAILVLAAGLCIFGASVFMWWATRRNALWAMAAGVLFGLIALAAAVLIAWLMTRHYWAALDPVHGR